MVRHFIKSGCLRPLEEAHEVLYVFPDKHKRVKTDVGSLDLPRVRFLPISTERAYRSRRLYHAAVLHRARHSENRQFLYTFWFEALGRRSFLKSWFWSWPATNWFYRKQIRRLNGANEELERLLAEERPDAVLHPTVLEGLFVSDLGDWASRNSQPVILLMNSWDNPSTKAMTLNVPAWLAVWGEQSKQHAIRHLGWNEDRLYCLGAAQFDIYRQPPARHRSEILRAWGLSPDRKVLLYAGSSKGLNEVAHLIELETAVREGRLPDCQILFRPHPWRGVIKGEPNFYDIEWTCVVMDPQMADYYRASRGDSSLMFMPDYEHTHELLSAVDAVVSPVSTILLEAVMHGKPILAYLPEEDIHDNFFMRTMANMNFMREFFERIPCGPCLSRSRFIEHCAQLLDSTKDPTIAERLKNNSQFFVVIDENSYGVRLLRFLEELGIPRLAGRMSVA